MPAERNAALVVTAAERVDKRVVFTAESAPGAWIGHLSPVERERALALIPPMVRLLPFLRGILGTRAFDAVVGRWFGVYRTVEAIVPNRHRG
mgnify:CR=1 FL=1